MKLFVYEYITSGALADQSLPASLAREGDDMLNAIIRDCNELAIFNISTIRDSRLDIAEIFNNQHHHCYIASTVTEHRQHWQQCLTEADVVLIIAPETGNVLADLQQQALNHNAIVLGCQVNAIKATSNKLTCYQLLKKNNISVVDTIAVSEWHQWQFDSESTYITKPIDGAGCIDTHLFKCSQALDLYLNSLTEYEKSQIIIQPYISGISASLSLLFTDDDVIVLAINEQLILCQNNTLSFTACNVNAISESHFSNSQAYDLAKQVHDVIPGLSGFVGIDFIISNNSAVIVDINPRVTSSYSDLRDHIDINPIALLWQMTQKDTLASQPIEQCQLNHSRL